MVAHNAVYAMNISYTLISFHIYNVHRRFICFFNCYTILFNRLNVAEAALCYEVVAEWATFHFTCSHLEHHLAIAATSLSEYQEGLVPIIAPVPNTTKAYGTFSNEKMID